MMSVGMIRLCRGQVAKRDKEFVENCRGTLEELYRVDVPGAKIVSCHRGLLGNRKKRFEIRLV